MRCPTHGECIRFFFVSKFKFKQMKRTIMKKSKGIYKHSVCGKVCRDAWEVKHREPTCRKCNSILLQQSRATNAAKESSDEVAALRQEVAELRTLVLRLWENLKTGAAVTDLTQPASLMETETEEEPIDMPSDQPPQQRPTPKTILIRGTGPGDIGLPCGKYEPFGGVYKDIYVPSSELKKGIEKKGYPDINLLSECRPKLTFKYFDGDLDEQVDGDARDAPGFYLVAVKGYHERAFLKEMPDASWRAWNEDAKEWVDIQESVPPLIHASYSY